MQYIEHILEVFAQPSPPQLNEASFFRRLSLRRVGMGYNNFIVNFLCPRINNFIFFFLFLFLFRILNE